MRTLTWWPQRPPPSPGPGEGSDLKDIPGGPPRPKSLALPAPGQIQQRLTETSQNMRAVSIAQVHGAAVGGSVLLMAACDLRIVATPALKKPLIASRPGGNCRFKWVV